MLNPGIRKLAHQKFASEKLFSQTDTDVKSQPEQLLYENTFTLSFLPVPQLFRWLGNVTLRENCY